MTEQNSELHTDRPVALVTGANKGIGYAIAAGLGALGYRVGVGARDADRGQVAVDQLRAAGVDAFAVPLDVTDDANVAAAAHQLRDRQGRLDVLVNNAGITGGRAQLPTEVTPDQLRTVLETNVIGVVRVTNAVLPLLREAPSARIVNVSSSVGSLSRQTASAEAVGPISGAYSPSKTALNALTIQYAKELADTNILINLACPGYVATDLNGHAGHRTPDQGAQTPIRLATLPDGGPTGGYFEDAGEIGW